MAKRSADAMAHITKEELKELSQSEAFKQNPTQQIQQFIDKGVD